MNSRGWMVCGATAAVLAAGSLVWSDPPAAGSKADKLAAAAWLTGDWRSADGSTTETWHAPAGGSMLGACRIGTNAGRSIYELMLIEQQGDDVYLLLKHFGAGLAPRHAEPYKYKLLPAGDEESRELVFENPETDRHRRIVYVQSGPDEIRCRLEDKPGGRRTQEFRMKRVP